MSENEQFEEGYEAYLDGRYLGANPYDWYDEQEKNEDWEDGWYTAHDDEKGEV